MAAAPAGDNLMTTDTHMLVSMLANSEKLLPRHEQTHFGDAPDQTSDTLESCMMSDNQEAHVSPNIAINNVEISSPKLAAPSLQPPSLSSIKPPVPPTANLLEMPTVPVEELDEYDSASPVRKRLLKMDMIRKLTELVKQGVKLSQNYNMDSDYRTMKYECELHNSIIKKHNSVRFLQDGLVTAVSALEKANTKFNPFGLVLDGWGESVGSKSDQLYDALGELYEKWSEPGKSMPPEITLLGILGFSAASTHWVNSSVKNIPSLDEKQKTDPQYIEEIRQRALGKTIDKNTNTKFVDKLAKQYVSAVEKAKDYQTLCNFEQQYRQSQAVKNAQPTQPVQSVQSARSTQSTQPQMKPPVIPAFMRKQRNVEDSIDNTSIESVVRISPDIQSIVKSAEKEMKRS
jgi:hypothetical protein